MALRCVCGQFNLLLLFSCSTLCVFCSIFVLQLFQKKLKDHRFLFCRCCVLLFVCFLEAQEEEEEKEASGA